MVRIWSFSLVILNDVNIENLSVNSAEVNRQQEIENVFVRRIKTHQGILHKICFVYSTNKPDRQDLYQEIILQLWKSYPSFSGRSEFSTWMYRVALNTAITLVKKRKTRSVRYKEHDQVYDPEKDMDYSEDVRILHKAISHLSRVEKAIVLMYLDENSYKEMAEALGMSVKNISVKLVRIKGKLAELIQKLQ